MKRLQPSGPADMGAMGKDETESPQGAGEEKWAQLTAQHCRRALALPPSALTSPCLSLSHWSPKGSDYSLRAAGRLYTKLEFLESRFSF